MTRDLRWERFLNRHFRFYDVECTRPRPRWRWRLGRRLHLALPKALRALTAIGFWETDPGDFYLNGRWRWDFWRAGRPGGA